MQSRKPYHIPALRLALLGLTLTLAPVVEPALAQDQPPDPHIGLVEAYQEPLAGTESGAGWERIPFDWSHFQPTSAADWETSAVPVEWLEGARDSGREVVGLIVNTPAWAADGDPLKGVPRGLYLPTDNPANLWAAFVRQLVTDYSRQGILHWIIWDEPDIPSADPDAKWAGSVGDYYQLVKVAYIAAKQANPSVQIHLAGISQASEGGWLSRYFDTVLADPTAAANNYYFDYATLHLFFISERVYDMTQSAFYLMQQKLGAENIKPVWIAELNARPGKDPGYYPDDLAFEASDYPNITLEQQAAFIVQGFALGFAAGAERIAVYKLTDGALLADEPDVWGLIRGDGNARPAYEAFWVVAQHFAGFQEAGRFPTDLADYVRLSHPDRVTHIAWARGEEDAMISITARGNGAVLVDMQGGETAIKPANGMYTLRLPGADCNDPARGCIIGGRPIILVEPVPLRPGGPRIDVSVVPAPTPGPGQPAPTDSPTAIPAATIEATQVPPTTSPDASPTQVTNEAAPPDPGAQSPGSQVSSLGRAVPFVMIALGVLVIVGGSAFYLAGWRRSPR
jgi:hypothetical protein